MKPIVPILFTVLLITSCRQKENNVKEEFIVPFIGTSFYGELNIAVDWSNTVYYYTRKPQGRFCGTGLDLTLPRYIGLYPDSLRPVTIPELKKLAHNPPFSSDKKHYIYVGINASKNNIYEQIVEQLKDLKQAEIVRRELTEEEQVVIAYKRTEINYLPYQQSWKNPNYDITYWERACQLKLDSVSSMYKKTPARLIWQKVVQKNNRLEYLKEDKFHEIWISRSTAPQLSIVERIQENGEGGLDAYEIFDIQQYEEYTLFKTVLEQTNDSIEWKFEYISEERMLGRWSTKKFDNKQFKSLGYFASGEN